MHIFNGVLSKLWFPGTQFKIENLKICEIVNLAKLANLSKCQTTMNPCITLSSNFIRLCLAWFQLDRLDFDMVPLDLRAMASILRQSQKKPYLSHQGKLPQMCWQNLLISGAELGKKSQVQKLVPPHPFLQKCVNFWHPMQVRGCSTIMKLLWNCAKYIKLTYRIIKAILTDILAHFWVLVELKCRKKWQNGACPALIPPKEGK